MKKLYILFFQLFVGLSVFALQTNSEKDVSYFFNMDNMIERSWYNEVEIGTEIKLTNIASFDFSITFCSWLTDIRCRSFLVMGRPKFYYALTFRF